MGLVFWIIHYCILRPFWQMFNICAIAVALLVVPIVTLVSLASFFLLSFPVSALLAFEKPIAHRVLPLLRMLAGPLKLDLKHCPLEMQSESFALVAATAQWMIKEYAQQALNGLGKKAQETSMLRRQQQFNTRMYSTSARRRTTWDGVSAL